ncbi:MAG TPA: hypothetical protein VFV19_14705 [Candidatus Polarisedimenticolaceae bacterium]|nr:hypothetical protein [Candidatus Polarisedimenticolaceae bacterium]
MRVVTNQRPWSLNLAITGLPVPEDDARAMALQETNLVDLLRDAESIVVGVVMSVTSGVSAVGLPFTEITLHVEESIRGSFDETYVFRQFRLTDARASVAPMVLMLPEPEGIPTYRAGERVLLFLGPVATMSGFRSTLGLGVGRFVIESGRAENGFMNAGVFSNVSVDPKVVTARDARILRTSLGGVCADDLLSLVRRAVQSSWTRTHRMWKTSDQRE